MNHLHSRHPNSYLFPLYLAYIVLIEDDIHWMNNTSSFMVYFRHLGVTLNSSILLNNFGGYNNNPTRPNISFFNYPVVVLFVVALPLLLFNLSFVPPCQRLSVLSFKPFPRILHLLFLFLLKGHQPAMLICFSVSTDAISPHFQHFLHLFVCFKTALYWSLCQNPSLMWANVNNSTQCLLFSFCPQNHAIKTASLETNSSRNCFSTADKKWSQQVQDDFHLF